MTDRDSYWCCKAEFGFHEKTCENYTDKAFEELNNQFAKEHGCLPPREYVYREGFQAGVAQGMEEAAVMDIKYDGVTSKDEGCWTITLPSGGIILAFGGVFLKHYSPCGKRFVFPSGATISFPPEFDHFGISPFRSEMWEHSGVLGECVSTLKFNRAGINNLPPSDYKLLLEFILCKVRTTYEAL